MSGTCLHGAECSTSIFQSWQTLQREKTDIPSFSETDASLWFHLWAPAILHMRPGSGCPAHLGLQVGPKLYPSVPPYCVWTGSYVLHPLAPASILSSEVPALQKMRTPVPPTLVHTWKPESSLWYTGGRMLSTSQRQAVPGWFSGSLAACCRHTLWRGTRIFWGELRGLRLWRVI